MKPLFKSLFRGSRYRKKDLVLLVTTLVIFLYTILPGGWSSSKSQIALQSPVQDGEVDIKNIGKLEGNNKIPKEPPKVLFGFDCKRAVEKTTKIINHNLYYIYQILII